MKVTLRPNIRVFSRKVYWARQLTRFPFMTMTLEPIVVAKLWKPAAEILLAAAFVATFVISALAMLQ